MRRTFRSAEAELLLLELLLLVVAPMERGVGGWRAPAFLALLVEVGILWMNLCKCIAVACTHRRRQSAEASELEK